MKDKAVNGEARELVSQAEFGRRQKWGRSYVTQLKKDGRLVLDGKRVDVAASLVRIKATEGRSRPDVAKRHEGARGKPEDVNGERSAVNGEGAPSAMDYANQKQEALAKAAHFEAERKEAEYLEMIGRLVDVDRVRLAGAEIGAHVRQRLESMPDSLAPLLAAEDEPERVHSILADAIEQLLTDMAQDIRKLVEG